MGAYLVAAGQASQRFPSPDHRKHDFVLSPLPGNRRASDRATGWARIGVNTSARILGHATIGLFHRHQFGWVHRRSRG